MPTPLLEVISRSWHCFEQVQDPGLWCMRCGREELISWNTASSHHLQAGDLSNAAKQQKMMEKDIKGAPIGVTAIPDMSSSGLLVLDCPCLQNIFHEGSNGSSWKCGSRFKHVMYMHRCRYGNLVLANLAHWQHIFTNGHDSSTAKQLSVFLIQIIQIRSNHNLMLKALKLYISQWLTFQPLGRYWSPLFGPSLGTRKKRKTSRKE